MMHSWQVLLLLISVPVLILSIVSFLGQVVGQLIRSLPYVFLIVFGFGGVTAIIDSGYRSGFLGGLELVIGTFTLLIVILNLYLTISNHKHNTAILRSRNPSTPIKNIVTDKIEKPRFTNPNAEQETLQSRVGNKLKSIKIRPTKARSINARSTKSETELFPPFTAKRRQQV